MRKQFDTVKRNLMVQNSELAVKLKIKKQHVLIQGGSGSGKSLLVQTLKNAFSNVNFISVSSTDIFSQYVGESEQNLRQIFNAAQQLKPSCVVFENLDLMLQRRDDAESDVSQRVLAQLLTEMDGVTTELSGVTCIATVSCDVQKMDSAITRFGRFGLHIQTSDIGPEEFQEFVTWSGIPGLKYKKNGYELMQQLR